MADACLAKVLEAAGTEQEAMAQDRRGEVQVALASYSAAEKALEEAVRLAPEGHAEDLEKLRVHRQELLGRMAHLRTLRPGQAPGVPLEAQVHTVELAMTRPGNTAERSAAAAPSSPPPSGTLVGAAAVGAIGGAVVLGGAVAMPLLGAVAGAAALGYAATRPDQLGGAARSVGGAAAAAAGKASELDQKYQISSTVAAKAQQVHGAVAARAPELSGAVQLKAQEIGSVVQSKAQEIGSKVAASAQDIKAGASEAASRGRELRGAADSDGYKFGDLTRGLVAEGKETRGASAGEGYKFGDFSRGLAKKMGWARAWQHTDSSASESAAASSASGAASL